MIVAAVPIKAVVERSGIDPRTIDDVILGCANQAGEDNRNVARMALLLAGLPVQVPGQTVNRLCGSGLQAVMFARREILVGDAEVIVAGGVVRARDRGIVGEATVEFIRQFKVDIGLIGISAIEADGTLRDYDYREVNVARAIIGQSREVWLVADRSKFNRPAMVELARIDQIDRLFTDAEPPPEFAKMLAEAGVECLVAP